MLLLSGPLCWLGFRAAIRWLPYPSDIEATPASAIEIDDRTGIPLVELAAADGQWRFPLSEREISPHLLHAIVAVEDARFFEHGGVDWKSVAAAAWDDLRHFRARRGASTLSMQVQRLRDPRRHTLWNKTLEAIRAEQLERRTSKQKILVEYVSRAPFGGNLVGAGAASRRYFGRPCARLSLGEAALLAGLPQSPNHLRPDRFPARAKARRDHVLDRMLARGFITNREHDEASAEPVGANWGLLPQDRPAGEVPAADGAMPTLVRMARERSGPLIRVTLDRTIQRQAARAAQARLTELRSSGISSASVVVLDNSTAACLAAVSLGPGENLIDLTRRPRSTGSTLKPFIYAAAFDQGVCSPGTILSDSPASWGSYRPNDYDRSFRGKLTAAEALAESRNIPAMMVLAKVGVEPAIGLMDAAGLHHLARTPRAYGLSLAIGGAEASPTELAAAYATLARGGRYLPVRIILGADAPGQGADAPLPTRANTLCLRTPACWQVLASLSDPGRTATVCPEARGSHVAWKTGTSSGHRDAWCAAVTRRFTVVVWLGNVEGGGSAALVGQEAAAPLALGLVAILDPHDDAWPAVREAVSPAAWSAQPARQWVMVSPADGQHIVLTPDAPLSSQRVVLRVGLRGDGEQTDRWLWWFVDGQLVGQSTALQPLWWLPAPGTHEIQVVDEAGAGTEARIHVLRR